MPQDTKPDVCRAIDVVAGSVGGALGGATFAFLTGNVEAVLPDMGVGAVVGGASSWASPSGGSKAMVIGAVASMRAGTRSPVSIVGDAVNSGTPDGAYTVPVGAMVGAGLNARNAYLGRGLAGLGVGESALVGGTAGAAAAAVGLATKSVISSTLGKYFGCTK